MATVSLSKLAGVLGCENQPEFDQIFVSGVSQSHDRVVAGDVFVASQGARVHAIEFARQAVQSGAVAVVTDRLLNDADFPQLLLGDPKSHIGKICNTVYPAIRSRLWGVTGTNGKTSTTTYLFRLLELLGAKAAFSGSTGYLPTALSASDGLTTPEADVLHRQIRNWEVNGIQEIVLEVSAQALSRNRVNGLHFAVSGFTNLSHDHLDEYVDMPSYLNAKATLFTPEYSEAAVISTADRYGRSIFEKSQVQKSSLSFEAAGGGGEGYVLREVENFELYRDGALLVSAEIRPGRLMSRNLALAVAMLVEAGFEPSAIQSVLPKLEISVPGRLQLVSSGLANRPDVFLDYAHTPDAIAASIAELRSRGYPRVTVVFSASGDRDHTKRPDMARAAATADFIVVTDFHPRTEDPKGIRLQLSRVLGELRANFADIGDPAEAIHDAIIKSESESAVLWCGPGHLKYREVGGQKTPFDPERIIKNIIEGAS